MKLFKDILNKILGKTEYTIEKNDSYEEFIPKSLKVEEEFKFESDTIVNLVEGGYLDTTSLETIAKYKSNLKILIEATKEKGEINDFVIIRNDNFFPNNWEWDVSSKNTGIEKKGSSFSYELRKALAKEKSINRRNKLEFEIPIPEDEMTKLLKDIDLDIGLIYTPVVFRSTKHFTINTPLSYTGHYNQVDSERTYTVIDKIDNFLNSGYAYSAAYVDAYLDVTHESLPISEDAIVLISEDNYKKISNNPEIVEQLKQRRLVIFKGDGAIAINMLLTELGILPARPENRSMLYDSEIENILEDSIINICRNNNVEYNLGHGNINGKGGHFSDLLDGYNRENMDFNNSFISFLISKFPEYEQIISFNILRNENSASIFIKAVGLNNILEVIKEFNQLTFQTFQYDYKRHIEDRATITPEISHIFKSTVKLVINYYKTKNDIEISIESKKEIEDLIVLFYHSETVEDQLLAATILNQKLNSNICVNDYIDNREFNMK